MQSSKYKLFLQAIVFVFALLIVISLSDSFLITGVTHQAYFNNQIAIIPHRGGAALYPEETALAYRHNVEQNADELDIDLQESKDHQLILFHDDTLDRTTNGTGAVNQFTLAQLKQFDAGYRWTKDNITFPFRGAGLQILSLEDFFTQFPNKHVQIEMKPNNPMLAREACAIIQKYKMTNKVLLFSYHDAVMQAIRSDCPGVATGASKREIRNLLIGSYVLGGALNRFAGSALIVPENYGKVHVVTPSLLNAAHRRSIRIYVYGATTKEELHRLINMNVDGLIVDGPELAYSVLNRKPHAF